MKKESVAEKDTRKTVVIVFKTQVTWRKREKFGDFVNRIRKAYAKRNGVKSPTVLVA